MGPKLVHAALPLAGVRRGWLMGLWQFVATILARAAEG